MGHEKAALGRETEALGRETAGVGRETQRFGSETVAFGRETARFGGQVGRLGSETEGLGAFKERMLAGTGRAAGSALMAAGDAAVKYIDQQQISHGALALTGLMADKTQQWNNIVKDADPNDGTVGQRFLATNLEPDLQELKKSFWTENAQRWAESHIDAYRKHMYDKTAADMSFKAYEAEKVNYRQTVNALSSTVRDDPSSLDFSIETLRSVIAAKIANSPNLRGTDAARLSGEVFQAGAESIIKSAAIGAIEKTGQVPAWVEDPKYAPYINGAELKMFAGQARYYQRLSASEDRAARVQADYEAKNDFHAKTNALETQTMPKNVGERPTLPADYWDQLRALSRHPGAALDPGRLKTLITHGEVITERLNKPEPLGRISHETTMHLLDRMRATDETRMTDNGLIYDEYRAGHLNNADFNFLTREFRDMRTPEGERLAKTKDEFFKSVAPKIDKSNPLMGKLDQDGKSNMYRLEWEVNKKVGEYRNAGKDPYDLFDPSKPDFMGRDEALEPYQKTLPQSARDAARRLTTGGSVVAPDQPPRPEPVPRKPRESAAKYLKRIGVE